jgi:hypothetical protein
VLGDNNSTDAFNGMADLAVAKNGDFFIADGEGPNTRVVKFHKDGQFVKWWAGRAADPASSMCRIPSRSTAKGCCTWETGRITAFRCSTSPDGSVATTVDGPDSSFGKASQR